jgi:hypothetical protein
MIDEIEPIYYVSYQFQAYLSQINQDLDAEEWQVACLKFAPNPCSAFSVQVLNNVEILRVFHGRAKYCH